MQGKSDPVIHIIDDDEAVRESLEAVLLVAGFAPHSYASAEVFLVEAPDRTGCLLLDVNMPGMSGLELLEHLARTERSIPTVILTANRDEGLRARAQGLGVNGFLFKPATHDDLVAALAAAMDGSGDGTRLPPST